jgi:hypothetical protein
MNADFEDINQCDNTEELSCLATYYQNDIRGLFNSVPGLNMAAGGHCTLL